MAMERSRLRLWANRPDMNTLAAGLAALAISAGLVGTIPNVNAHPNLFRIAVWATVSSGLLGFGLLWRGLFNPVPLVDIEEPWNTVYDELRDASARFIADVIDPYFSMLRVRHEDSLTTWKLYVERVAIPRPDKGPLHEWGEHLRNHKSPYVRQFYELAVSADTNMAGGEYRRFAVRTYDMFRRSRETRPGFKEWMEQERVAEGAEALVVLLAYMEVARACSQKIGKNPTHLGFWLLAEEWHNHDVMTLPKLVSEGLRPTESAS